MKTFLIWLLSLIIVVCFATWLLTPPAVRVGQVWRYQTDRSPFPDCQDGYITHTYKVLEVKRGWVKSVDETGRVSCDRTDWFVTGAKKVTP
jgi:hypothetical protein